MKGNGHSLLAKPPGGGGPPAHGKVPVAAVVKSGAGSAPFPTKYLFTLTSVIDQQFVGETPGGFRIDLAYSAPQPPPAPAVTFKWPSSLQPPVLGYVAGAALLSGTDWVSVSRQGIIDFDSRVTLSLDTKGAAPNAPGEPCLISTRLRGRASLHDALDPNNKPLFAASHGSNQVISTWRKGFPTGSTLDVKLAVTADVPIEGFDPPQTNVYRQCAQLGNSLLLGRAKVTYTQGDFGAVSAIELDVYST